VNQFTDYKEPTAYNIVVNLAEYKMYRRLRMLKEPSEVILYLGASGQIYDLSVAGKREHLIEFPVLDNHFQS
jgi:hypothetical protein